MLIRSYTRKLFLKLYLNRGFFTFKQRKFVLGFSQFLNPVRASIPSTLNHFRKVYNTLSGEDFTINFRKSYRKFRTDSIFLRLVKNISFLLGCSSQKALSGFKSDNFIPHLAYNISLKSYNFVKNFLADSERNLRYKNNSQNRECFHMTNTLA